MTAEFSDYPINTKSGSPRRVGFEIEYIDYSLSNSVELIENMFGGDIIKKNAHYYYIDNTRYGRFGVERDLQLLHDLSSKSIENKSQGKVDIEGIANSVLTNLFEDFIPIEIVTPPISFDDINIVNLIVEELRKTTANDTNKSILTAFGLHINPELPDLEPKTILNYIRAYCLLNEWLRDKIKVNISRKISPFIDEYPSEYVKLVLSCEYMPTESELIDDYLRFNNTRNRSLDLLPLFKHLDEDKITQKIPNENVKARPTFHYRLPNTSFREENWSPIIEWNRWLMVEKIANNETHIEELSKKYLSQCKDKLFFDKNKWVNEIKCFLKKI